MVQFCDQVVRAQVRDINSPDDSAHTGPKPMLLFIWRVFPRGFSAFAWQHTVSRRSFESSGVCDMSSPRDSA